MVLGLKFFAISGSCGPHKFLKDWTTFSCLTSSTMHGPIVIDSIIGINSAKTPLYNSKNSSAVGLSRVKSYIDEISKPSERIKSIIYPATPACTAWGLIIQHVQLLPMKVDGIAGLKKKSTSRFADGPESDPCTAFLVPSVPNWALNDLGASYFAVSELVGPITDLQLAIAFSETISMPVTTSEVIKLDRLP